MRIIEGIGFLILPILFQIACAEEIVELAALPFATCTPDNCIRNFMREKLWDFQRECVENGHDIVEVNRTISFQKKTLGSDLQFTYQNIRISGLCRNMNINSASISSTVLNGYLYISMQNVAGNLLTVTGDYSASGIVNKEDVASSGTFYFGLTNSLTTPTYYSVDADGLIRIKSQSGSNTISYSYSNRDFLENMLERSHPFLAVIVQDQGKNIIGYLRSDVTYILTNLQNYIKEQIEGVPLTFITEWEGVPTAPPPTTTVQPTNPTTALPFPFPCLPWDCVSRYFNLAAPSFKVYESLHGLETLALNRTFSDRTLTTVFDMQMVYSNVTVENVLSQLTSLYQYSINFGTSMVATTWRIPRMQVRGTFTGNGTILGQVVERTGTWSGLLDEAIQFNVKLDIGEDGRMKILRSGSSAARYTSWTSYNFESDMFPTLHPLKEPFDALLKAQLTAAIRQWFADFLHIYLDAIEVPFNERSAVEIITGEDPPTFTLPPDWTTIPYESTTTTPRPPFQCEPDTCLVDYIRLKLNRFPDWVDAEERDPLVFPNSYAVTFDSNNIWKISLLLSNVTVHGYLPTFLNTGTSFTSNCLSGTIQIATTSPTLNYTGYYKANGSLEEYSLDKEGEFNMGLRIRTTHTIIYRIDDEGYISEMTNQISTSLQTTTSVNFTDLVDPSVPLASLLQADINSRSTSQLGQQMRVFTPMFTDFVEFLLTENKFYDIITWHRYGNETTDPPVVCSKSLRSSVQISNWFIPMMGHVPLKIVGSRFDILRNVQCRFQDTEEIIKDGTVLDHSNAFCTIPYLYSWGWVDVEITLTYANGCEQKFQNKIYSATPEQYKETLEVSESEPEELAVSWNAQHFGDSDLFLNLYGVAIKPGTGEWSETPGFLTSTENNGETTVCLDTINTSLNGAHSFVLFLEPENETLSQEVGRLYSDVQYSDFGKPAEEFQELCQSWYEQDPGPPKNLEPCPPLLAQAWLDPRFEYEWSLQDPEKLNFFKPGAEFVFHQVIPNSDAAGSNCAYRNGSIYIAPPGGANADYSSPRNKTGFLPHHITDILPWYICCKWSQDEDSCNLYYEKRPTSSGEGYIPPRPGNGEGDPHITTFDGASYTFNGVGEFWMIQSTLNEAVGRSLSFQARMEQFKLNGTVPMNASIFTAFSFQEANKEDDEVSSIQVSLDENENNQLSLLFDGDEVQIPEEISRKFPFTITNKFNASLSIHFKEDKVERAVILFPSGFAFNVSVIPGQAALQVVSSATLGLASQGYVGLMGAFDGDRENDLTFPGQPHLPLNATLQDIHERFGLLWRTTAGDSTFKYGFSKTHASYQDHAFQPTFDVPDLADHPEAEEICGQSKDCLFDLVSTGNVDFAKETKKAEEDFHETEDTLKEEVVICSERLEAPANGRIFLDNYLAGSVARFECHSGFQLEGSSESVCRQDGTWDSEAPLCIPGGGGFDCKDKEDGYYPDRTDCSKYFACLKGNTQSLTCPFPLKFDSVSLICVSPNNANCA